MFSFRIFKFDDHNFGLHLVPKLLAILNSPNTFVNSDRFSTYYFNLILLRIFFVLFKALLTVFNTSSINAPH